MDDDETVAILVGKCRTVNLQSHFTSLTLVFTSIDLLIVNS
jgi:hypothetical protein